MRERERELATYLCVGFMCFEKRVVKPQVIQLYPLLFNGSLRHCYETEKRRERAGERERERENERKKEGKTDEFSKNKMLTHWEQKKKKKAWDWLTTAHFWYSWKRASHSLSGFPLRNLFIYHTLKQLSYAIFAFVHSGSMLSIVLKNRISIT